MLFRWARTPDPRRKVQKSHVLIRMKNFEIGHRLGWHLPKLFRSCLSPSICPRARTPWWNVRRALRLFLGAQPNDAVVLFCMLGPAELNKTKERHKFQYIYNEFGWLGAIYFWGELCRFQCVLISPVHSQIHRRNELKYRNGARLQKLGRCAEFQNFI